MLIHKSNGELMSGLSNGSAKRQRKNPETKPGKARQQFRRMRQRVNSLLTDAKECKRF
jgi:hypothetical protein